MKTILSTALAAVLLSALPQSALAQEEDAEVTRMAKEHYKLGLDAYKNAKYDVAIKELKKAYLLKRLPALLLNIGATYRKMGDLDLALHFYQKYLDEAPAEAPDRADVQKTLNEIKAQKAGGGVAEPSAPARGEGAEPAQRREESPPPMRTGPMPREWSHSVIDAAPPGTPIDVRVTTPVMKGVKVYVYYRQPGEADFRGVLMKRRGTEKVGRIPADALNGTSVQYYIEARDPAGTVIKSSGSQSNPNIVMIDPTAKPQLIASRGDEEREPEPQEEARPSKSMRSLDDEAAPTTGRLDDEPRVAPRAARPQGKLSGLGIGGAVLLGIGAGGLGLGITGLVLAKQNADSLSADSARQYKDENGTPIYFNNDPVSTAANVPQAAALQSRGKMWNAIGIAGTVVGSVCIVGGTSMLLADTVFRRTTNERPKRRRRRPVEEDEVSHNWYLAPAVSPSGASVSGGFSF